MEGKFNQRGQALKAQTVVTPMKALREEYNRKHKFNEPSVLMKAPKIIPFSEGIRKASGISSLGFEAGNLILFTGRSNTGKTTQAVLSGIEATKNGAVMVIFDMENKFNFDRARKMGLEYIIHKICVNTGEILATEGDDNFDSITEGYGLDYEGNFLYYNTFKLFHKYHKKDKGIVSFEDFTNEVYDLWNFQEEQSKKGNVFDYYFILDSYDKLQGTTYYSTPKDSKGDFVKSDELKTNAQSNTQHKNIYFETLVKEVITQTKSCHFPYINTMIAMTGIYDDKSGHQSVGREYGGSKLKGISGMRVRFGKQTTDGVKNVFIKGRIIGTSVEVDILKVHTSTGTETALAKIEVVNTAHGSIPNNDEEIKKYCKAHKELFNTDDFDDDSEITYKEIEE